MHYWRNTRSKVALLEPALTEVDARNLFLKCLAPPIVALIAILMVQANFRLGDYLIDLRYFVPFGGHGCSNWGKGGWCFGYPSDGKEGPLEREWIN
ncbi:MAG: hypothetical protein WCF90_10155 [Methanomicrobiales archaeon]